MWIEVDGSWRQGREKDDKVFEDLEQRAKASGGRYDKNKQFPCQEDPAFVEYSIGDNA